MNAGDSRFCAAAYAAAPRRACPALSMFFAALWSRCRLVPQSGQGCHPTERPFWTITPQPEQVWLGLAGGTATTRFPAHTAFEAKRLRQALHPPSPMVFAT